MPDHYDVAEICQNGHVTNSMAHDYPVIKSTVTNAAARPLPNVPLAIPISEDTTTYPVSFPFQDSHRRLTATNAENLFPGLKRLLEQRGNLPQSLKRSLKTNGIN